MGVLGQISSFVETDAATMPTGAPADINKLKEQVAAAWPKMPKADEQRLDSKGMQDMRVDAFEKDDQQAALQWASNITELKTRCLDKPGTNTDATLESCRVLANESMYMAAKYYQMWESTLSLWNSQNAMQGLEEVKGDAAFGEDAVTMPDADSYSAVEHENPLGEDAMAQQVAQAASGNVAEAGIVDSAVGLATVCYLVGQADDYQKEKRGGTQFL